MLIVASARLPKYVRLYVVFKFPIHLSKSSKLGIQNISFRGNNSYLLREKYLFWINFKKRTVCICGQFPKSAITFTIAQMARSFFQPAICYLIPGWKSLYARVALKNSQGKCKKALSNVMQHLPPLKCVSDKFNKKSMWQWFCGICSKIMSNIAISDRIYRICREWNLVDLILPHSKNHGHIDFFGKLI